MTTAFTATADKIGWYVEQAAGGTGSITAYLFKAGGESDGSLADRGTLAAVKSTNTECDFTGYQAKDLTSPARSVDSSGDRVRLTASGTLTWSGAGGATNNTIARIIYCYKPTAGAATSAILPLMSTDISATTNGNDLQVTLHADGWAVVSARI